MSSFHKSLRRPSVQLPQGAAATKAADSKIHSSESVRIETSELSRKKHVYPLPYATPTVSDVAVIIPFFNPSMSTRMLQNICLIRHLHTLANIPTFFVELAFGDAPFILKEDSNTFQYRSSSYMFYKDNLFAVAEKRIPETFTKLMILDADIYFEDSKWYDKLSLELNTVNVVQPYSLAIYLEIDFIPTEEKTGAVKLKTVGHPGFAWAFQRSWFQTSKFFDMSVIGGGDRVFAHRVECDVGIDSIYLPDLSNSMTECTKSYLDIVIYHLPHGLKKNRQYNMRIQKLSDILIILNKSKISDLITRRSDGILEWKIAYKERLNTYVKTYFENRKDDSV